MPQLAQRWFIGILTALLVGSIPIACYYWLGRPTQSPTVVEAVSASTSAPSDRKILSSQERAARQARYEATSKRFFEVMEVAQKFGLTKEAVLLQAGEPTFRSKKDRITMPDKRGSDLLTDDVLEEAWSYVIDEGVRIAIDFDAKGKSAGFSSSGIRFFRRQLFNEP